MAYITKDDLLPLIREDELDAITTDDNIINYMIDVAEDEAKSLVGHRFDFNTPSPKMKHTIAVIAIYHLYSQIAPNKMPVFRRVQYNNDGNPSQAGSAIGYLRDLQKGNQSTPLAVKTDPDGNAYGNVIESGNDTLKDSYSNVW
jgi:hypothetical protein